MDEAAGSQIDTQLLYIHRVLLAHLSSPGDWRHPESWRFSFLEINKCLISTRSGSGLEIQE